MLFLWRENRFILRQNHSKLSFGEYVFFSWKHHSKSSEGHPIHPRLTSFCPTMFLHSLIAVMYFVANSTISFLCWIERVGLFSKISRMFLGARDKFKSFYPFYISFFTILQRSIFNICHFFTYPCIFSSTAIIFWIFAFGTYIMWGKYCNHQKIWLWHIYKYVHFEVSWIY